MEPNRKLRIFRLKDGVRIPYVIELDGELTVIAEYADVTVVDHITEGRRDDRHDDAVKRIVTAVARWSARAITDNPIPGTDDLRQQFFSERDALEKSFKDAGRDCPGCEISKLMRRYRDKLSAAGHLDHLK